MSSGTPEVARDRRVLNKILVVTSVAAIASLWYQEWVSVWRRATERWLQLRWRPPFTARTMSESHDFFSSLRHMHTTFFFYTTSDEYYVIYAGRQMHTTSRYTWFSSFTVKDNNYSRMIMCWSSVPIVTEVTWYHKLQPSPPFQSFILRLLSLLHFSIVLIMTTRQRSDQETSIQICFILIG